MYKKIYTNELAGRLAEKISEPFLIKKITKCTTSVSSKTYLDFVLQDRRGYVKARAWEPYISDKFYGYKNSVVKVYGQIIQNQQEEIEIVISELIPLNDYIINEYVNGLSKDDTDKYVDLLFKCISKVKHEAYGLLLKTVFKEHINLFKEVPASVSGYAAFNGGLLVHSVSMACQVNSIKNNLTAYNRHPNYCFQYDNDLLVTAALLHMVGAIKLYPPLPVTERINLSVLLTLYDLTIGILYKAISQSVIDINTPDMNLLIHCIQCIHSQDIKPMVREGVILKNTFDMQTSISKIEYFINKNQNKRGSIFDKQLNNYIYIKEDNCE